MTIPTKEGFFWGQWRIKDAGTADEHEDIAVPEWEVIHVVENCNDVTHPEFLKAMVPGVAKWQSLENFFWGEQVKLPVAYLKKDIR